MTSTRMPTAFIPHGGGPWPILEIGGNRRETEALANYMRSIPSIPAVPPKALLVISAHWEARVPTVMTSPAPPMYYDYSGFSPEAYALNWPAPGSPEVAERTRQLLEGAGFATAQEPQRGFDHGTFVPLLLAYPQADIPTVQLSLIRGLDPAQHLAMGRALAPLRDEGVFVIGSGNSYHNLRALRDPDPRHVDASRRFDDWLTESVLAEESQRDRSLTAWAAAPGARLSHPREEHLIPLMVAAGAAGADAGSVTWSGTMMGKIGSAHHFGGKA